MQKPLTISRSDWIYTGTFLVTIQKNLPPTARSTVISEFKKTEDVTIEGCIAIFTKKIIIGIENNPNFYGVEIGHEQAFTTKVPYEHLQKIETDKHQVLWKKN